VKHRLILVATALLLLAPLTARAGERNVILDVKHADCVLCGPIVKASLERVHGVKTVKVFQPDAMANVSARVTYDDSVTNVDSLIAATTKAGYPSTVQQ
jgi:copper chaperone CopZ